MQDNAISASCVHLCEWFTLPETNGIFATENGWLEDEFPFGARPIFRGYVMLVSGRGVDTISPRMDGNIFWQHKNSYVVDFVNDAVEERWSFGFVGYC